MGTISLTYAFPLRAREDILTTIFAMIGCMLQLFNAVAASPWLASSTYIVLTSDNGADIPPTLTPYHRLVSSRSLIVIKFI